MDVIRMLVRSMQNTTWAEQAFLKYGRKGELRKLAALFLAVPELFLSSPESNLSLLSKLGLELKNKTDVEKQMLLLLDVFALVGQKLAAYIRLEEFAVNQERIPQSHLEMDFFLREVARKKPGVSSPDYYLSFFEADQPNYCSFYDVDDPPDWDDCVSDLEGIIDIFNELPYLLTRKDFVRTNIFRLIPSLDCEDAARLTRAIEKKFPTRSAMHGGLEPRAKISKKIKKGENRQNP